MDVVLGISMGSTVIRMVLYRRRMCLRCFCRRKRLSASLCMTRWLHSRTRASACDDSAYLGRHCRRWRPTNINRGWLRRDLTEVAASLAQNVGCGIGYQRTAMLLIEPGYATVSIVGSNDGSVTDVHQEPLELSPRCADFVEQLDAMPTDFDEQESRP